MNGNGCAADAVNGRRESIDLTHADANRGSASGYPGDGGGEAERVLTLTGRCCWAWGEAFEPATASDLPPLPLPAHR